MNEYKKGYLVLFNVISDTIEALDDFKIYLTDVQRAAEKMFIEHDENKEDENISAIEFINNLTGISKKLHEKNKE